MNYIIDGHNLIGQIADIDLSDPDDEAKLILRLLNWAATGKNRRVIVVFDRGVPGMQWHNFHSELVKPVFVAQHGDADDWIVRFLYDHVQKDVGSYHVVTSDRQILKHAENRRIAWTTSDAFARLLQEEREQWSKMGRDREPEPEQRAKLAPHEVDAWLAFFGGEPEVELPAYQPRLRQPEPEQTPVAAEASVPDDREEGLLSPAEVAAWLDLFGGEPKVIKPPEPSLQAKHRRRIERPVPKPPKNTPRAKGDSPLSQDDIDLWHSLFGDGG